MNREGALGILLIVALLGGIVLLTHRPVTSNYSAPQQYHGSGNIKIIPVQQESRRYQNKEIRQIEYNEDNLPTKITITRDYAIT